MTDNPSEIAELICAAYERGKESVYESDAMRLYAEQKARIEELEARLQGSEVRTKEVLESKNYWFDRADKAEKQVDELERSLRAAEALHADDQRELERLKALVSIDDNAVLMSFPNILAMQDAQMDAELGSLIRQMPSNHKLERLGVSTWHVIAPGNRSYPCGRSPEEALRQAG